jgi:hypothetical protein
MPQPNKLVEQVLHYTKQRNPEALDQILDNSPVELNRKLVAATVAALHQDIDTLAFGALSFLMMNLTDVKALQPGLIALSIFHTGAAASQIYGLTNGTANIPVIIAHSLFAVSFIGVLWQQIR